MTRLTILDTNDNYLTTIDNDLPDALHYSAGKVHDYLLGTTGTLEITTYKKTDEASKITVGCKVATTHNDEQRTFTIVDVDEDEYELSFTAMDLNLLLNYSEADAYKASRAMTFAEYLEVFDPEKTLTIDVNEIAAKKLTLEWTSTETVFARLIALAQNFDAEIKFRLQRNKNFTVSKLYLDIYAENDDTHQGIGEYRPEVKIEYGRDVTTIKRKVNAMNVVTAVRPLGKDNLDIRDLVFDVKNEAGEIEFYSFDGSGWIYAPLARDQFSGGTGNNPDGRYIYQTVNYETDSKQTLKARGLTKIKELCKPIVTYDVQGYFPELKLGDTVRIYDEGYTPTLMLQARVSEIVADLVNPAQSQVTFTNFKVLKSQISSDLLKKMKELIDANKTYNCEILSNAGTVFKSKDDMTKLTARVLDGVRDVTDNYKIIWFKDDVELPIGKIITVKAADFDQRALYRYEAYREDSTIIGRAEVTLVFVADGQKGEKGDDAIAGNLSNNPISIACDWEGNVKQTTTPLAVGFFDIYKGTEVFTGAAYSVVSADGVTATIDSSGKYSINAITKDVAIATFKAVITIDGKTTALQKTVSVNKVRDVKIPEDGKDGKDVVSGYLTNATILVGADADGVIYSDALKNADGFFIVQSGNSTVSNNIEYSLSTASDMTVSIDQKTGYYKITSLTGDQGVAIFNAVYNGVRIRLMLNAIKIRTAKDGETPVVVESATQPATPYVGMLWKNTTTGIIKRWTGASWVTFYIYADNIVASNLAAITAKLGDVTAGRIKLVSSDGYYSYYEMLTGPSKTMYLDNSQQTFWTDSNNYVTLSYDGITAVKNGKKYLFSFHNEGFGFWPADSNGNTGLDFYGDSTYIDLRNVLTEPSADFGARLWMPNNKYVVELLSDISGMPSHIWLTAMNGGSINLNGSSVNVRNATDTAWSQIVASAFTQQSTHSSKQDFESIETKDLLTAINETDIVKYHFKEEAKDGKPDDYVGFVINDDGQSPYKTSDLLINRDRTGFNTTTAVGIMMGAIKELSKQNKELEKRIERLEASK